MKSLKKSFRQQASQFLGLPHSSSNPILTKSFFTMSTTKKELSTQLLKLKLNLTHFPINTNGTLILKDPCKACMKLPTNYHGCLPISLKQTLEQTQLILLI